MMNPQMPFGLANLNRLIEYRAQTIAFSNDFLFMFYVGIPALGAIWLMRRPQFLSIATPKAELLE